jgi:hypothetical protein
MAKRGRKPKIADEPVVEAAVAEGVQQPVESVGTGSALPDGVAESVPPLVVDYSLSIAMTEAEEAMVQEEQEMAKQLGIAPPDPQPDISAIVEQVEAAGGCKHPYFADGKCPVCGARNE